jgi:hypothetical protein
MNPYILAGQALTETPSAVGRSAKMDFSVGTPSLLKIPFVLPAYLLILSALAFTALGYASVLGSIGGFVGRWTSAPPQETRIS